MAYLEDTAIEDAARNLRRQLGIDDQLRPDLMTVIVKLKRLGMIKGYLRVPNTEMAEDDAEYDPDQRVLRLAERTFIGMNARIPRARFTIAHEIGHVALGHKKLRHRNVTGRTIEKVAPSIRQDEIQANLFAGAFLAPAHLVPVDPHALPPEQLAELFAISPAAAGIRKPQIERQYRRLHRIERPLPQSVINFLNDKKR